MAKEGTIIVKKVKKVSGHGHHGGAWKVAYADFVTAMMAFFLLMWLINMTSPEQKQGIADYFAPASVSQSTSGAGGVLAGTAFDDAGSRGSGAIIDNNELSPTQPQNATGGQSDGDADGQPTESDTESVAQQTLSDEIVERALAQRENYMFEQAEMSLRQAMQDMPDLADLSRHLIVDQTPEGLRIQLVDQEGRPMFPPGGSDPYSRTVILLESVAEIVQRLPNRISIAGHTDSAPFFRNDGYSNWEISADRANSARRVLQESGVNVDRIYQVSGKAGSDPLYPDDPFAPANRRISIVLLREAPVMPADHEL